ITVHMFNGNVPESIVSIFLKRFVDLQGEGKKVMDEENVWTAKWRYMARFRTCLMTPGGVLHPPATFTIGPNRGYLMYPGQPKTCRRCGQEGHLVVDCRTEICRRCGRTGHVAAVCHHALVCNLCGEEGHLYRNCPK
ncbi:ZCHC3 protein, partial [Atractosteus spatula]|nr:ZCHC3 protein [Atractosteus spatula]